MRSLRSFLATTRMAHSSTRSRPILEASATRTEYCSMVSGWVEGSISTAIWMPLPRSNSLRRESRSRSWDAESVPVRSVTCALSGGTATSARAEARPARRTPAATRPGQHLRMRGLLLGRRAGLAEIDRRRLGDGLLVFDAEARLHLVAEKHRSQIDRKLAYEHVVFLHRLDVAVGRDPHSVPVASTLPLHAPKL